jgi:hypothetical protein
MISYIVVQQRIINNINNMSIMEIAIDAAKNFFQLKKNDTPLARDVEKLDLEQKELKVNTETPSLLSEADIRKKEIQKALSNMSPDDLKKAKECLMTLSNHT